MIFTVPKELDGITVKQFLRKYCFVSARTLAKLKRVENGITVDGNIIKSIDTLRAGDKIKLVFPEDELHIEPVDLSVEVVYEDNGVIVFNKPAGMPVHPVHEYTRNTLANAAAFYMHSREESYTFRPVNRLDKDTSGLVLCAKNRYAAAFLPSHTDKLYLALCEGRVDGCGTIDRPIRIKEGHTIQREIGEGGVRAVTHYEAIKHYEDKYTLLKIRLETGRTHQIRVHFAYLGHPLAGDDMYGGSRTYFSRQCLHCAEMTFTSPETLKNIMVKREIDFLEKTDDCLLKSIL